MPSINSKIDILHIPTYGLGAPEKNPVFFEKRVYQGSSGKVYPVPFIDKVDQDSPPEPVSYQAAHLENEFVRLVMLPEIGGRIFLGQDKLNDDYDFFYRQDVIKPALVGLAGPWISGGVEFNWPQHHRPGTYMPCDVHLAEEKDGSHTVWLSEHDPLNRMKGMHGIRLRPESCLVELKARLYNRTPFTQTFLWWANVAVKVHEQYQSFFPPDVHYVADHAVRAQSSFPIAKNDYYGVDYAVREGANDLSWYKNIPVPTSYMVCDTRFDFFGGYDHEAQGGFIHVANRHIAPGKKQWTWGDHAFGHSWDRELTDENGPYIELMAGVYTDNQPDFSYLLPYETKTFSQYWWPYQKIGPVQNATKEAAVRLIHNEEDEDGSLDLGAVVSRKYDNARIILREGESILIDERFDLSPDTPWQKQNFPYQGDQIQSLLLTVESDAKVLLVSYQPVDVDALERQRELATEPPMPEELDNIEELYLTAEHLEQYRHPTRYPELYWEEVLRRDPHDARTNIAYGRKKLARGLLAEAQSHFQTAIKRLTHRHPNPYTGEGHYYLGLCLRYKGQHTEAYAAFYKATWNFEWRAAAYYELATLDCIKGDYEAAIDHCETSLDTNRQNNKVLVIKALALQKLGCGEQAAEVLQTLLANDPLDHWARYASGDLDGFLSKSRNDAQTILDLVYDFADAGFRQEAINLLKLHHANEVSPVQVPNPLERSQLTHYALAWLQDDEDMLDRARALAPDYFFPSRLHDQLVLEWALRQEGHDDNAAYGLGNYFYHLQRHEEAITLWEQVTPFATVCRNLGIAYWNVRRDGPAARNAYEQAISIDPVDARIFAEYDQLRAKLGDSAEDRLASLLAHPDLVNQRDDASIALAELYNQTGAPEQALQLLQERSFHPWEGGEGKVLRQYTTAHILLGQHALEANDAHLALEHFGKAMSPPENLGEAYHLLQAKADVSYWTGMALKALGRSPEADAAFQASTHEAGDFQAMAVTEHSELSYYRGLSLIELGRHDDAAILFEDLKSFAQKELTTPAKIDYFATSLPLLLVFEDDLDQAKQNHARNLIDLAEQGLQQTR